MYRGGAPSSRIEKRDGVSPSSSPKHRTAATTSPKFRKITPKQTPSTSATAEASTSATVEASTSATVEASTSATAEAKLSELSGKKLASKLRLARKTKETCIDNRKGTNQKAQNMMPKLDPVQPKDAKKKYVFEGIVMYAHPRPGQKKFQGSPFFFHRLSQLQSSGNASVGLLIKQAPLSQIMRQKRHIFKIHSRDKASEYSIFMKIERGTPLHQYNEALKRLNSEHREGKEYSLFCDEYSPLMYNGFRLKRRHEEYVRLRPKKRGLGYDTPSSDGLVTDHAPWLEATGTSEKEFTRMESEQLIKEQEELMRKDEEEKKLAHHQRALSEQQLPRKTPASSGRDQALSDKQLPRNTPASSGRDEKVDLPVVEKTSIRRKLSGAPLQKKALSEKQLPKKPPTSSERNKNVPVEKASIPKEILPEKHSSNKDRTSVVDETNLAAGEEFAHGKNSDEDSIFSRSTLKMGKLSSSTGTSIPTFTTMSDKSKARTSTTGTSIPSLPTISPTRPAVSTSSESVVWVKNCLTFY